jgi:hypothetical protein
LDFQTGKINLTTQIRLNTNAHLKNLLPASLVVIFCHYAPAANVTREIPRMPLKVTIKKAGEQ